MKLAAYIIDSMNYLEMFNSNWYPGNFEIFRTKLEKLYEGLSPNGRKNEGSRIVWYLEEHINCAFFLARNRRRYDCARILALFVIPAALKMEGGEAFAEEICREWNRKYPELPIKKGTYEEIMSGFEPRLFGVPIRKD